MGKNDVLMEEGQGLTDGGLIKAFRRSEIFKNYRLREEAMRRTATIDFVTHTHIDFHDKGIRDQFPTYLRPCQLIGISRNEFNEHKSSNWGLADTYDRKRKIPKA